MWVINTARQGDRHRPGGYSVVWIETGEHNPFNDAGTGSPWNLQNFRNRPLPQSLLDAISAEFAAARAAGVKLMVRFAYNYTGTGEDTTRDWMLAHIAQLAPILRANSDTIAHMNAGFIGAWGELHSSTHLIPGGSSNPGWYGEEGRQARNAIFNALLDALPNTVSINIRYPRFVRELFGRANDTGYIMDLNQRFSGSRQSRVGWSNDCFVVDRTNVGTYRFWEGEDQGNLDRDTFMRIGRYAPGTGETCSVGGLTPFSSCSAALQEMATMGGPDALYRKYYFGIYDRWIAEGCYHEISRRLGYRLVLDNMTLPTTVSPGGAMSVQATIRNVGFGKVYNPRPMDLIFVGPSGAHTARMDNDARFELPLRGETVTSTFNFTAPTGLQRGGTYSLFLRLPDSSPRLAGDTRFAIRLANVGLWDATTGRHNLNATVTAQ
jgi:hypothetical protein